MSTHVVEVFKIKLLPHNNADLLSLVRFKDFQSVVRTTNWSDGELAVFIPPDSIIPDNIAPELSSRIIRAVRLRGEISEGLVIKAPTGSKIGDDVSEIMNITHYEPTPEEKGQEESEIKPHSYTPCYDLENAKVFANNLFKEGDSILITEKIHGQNWRGLFDGEILHIGSKTEWKRESTKQAHWQALTKNMRDCLMNNPNLMFIGEAVGRTKGFSYGVTNGNTDVFIFDIYDCDKKTFLPQYTVTEICSTNAIKRAPILYCGYYSGNISDYFLYAEGKSELDSHVREGCVIRLAKHSNIPGHVVPALKIVGIDYLSGKRRK